MTAPTILVNGELTIPLTDRTLVASTSEPNAWHVVTESGCDCTGFYYRRACKHVALAAEAQRSARQLAAHYTPAVVTACLNPPTPSYYEKPIVDMSEDEYRAWLKGAYRWAKERHIPLPR